MSLPENSPRETCQIIPLGVETLHIQIEYARHRLPSLKGANVLRLMQLQKSLARIERDLRELVRGRDPYQNRKGVLLRAYYSDIDDTLQPFSVAVPRSYDGRKPFPMIIHLHVHGWFRPFQGHPAPRIPHAIVLSPHGRGSTDYMYIGEQDVLQALALMRRLYKVDEERVYLVGESMGGTGCWHLSVHHPELFAAIAVASGNTDHTVWETKWGWGGAPETAMLSFRRQIERALDPIAYAANLKYVPVYCAHGAADTVVPVEHSRNMVRRLRQLGGHVKYEEFPGREHGDLPGRLFKDQVAWLLRQRRSPHHRCAQVLPVHLLPGKLTHAPVAIETAFLSPFLLVYGTTSASLIENVVARREAEQFAREWKRRYGHRCRIKADTAVSQEDMRQFNLILYGGPDTNRVARSFASQLPVQIQGETMTFQYQPSRKVGGRTIPFVFKGDDVGCKCITPHPLNSQRHIVLFAGTSWKGLFQINHRFGNWFDWGVYDNRNWYEFAFFDDKSVDPEGFLLVGFYGADAFGARNTQILWTGDLRVRQQVVPRQTPLYLEPPHKGNAFSLSSLMPLLIDQQKGTVEFNRSFQARPLRVGNRQFEKGLGVRAPSRVVFDLKGRWARFRATVGLDAEGEPVSAMRREVEKVRFKVVGDGIVLAESGDIDWDRNQHVFDVSIKGVRHLALVTEPRDRHLWLFGSAAWGEVEVSR